MVEVSIYVKSNFNGESRMKDKILIGTFGFVAIIGLILGFMYFARFFNAATLHTQIITPKQGVECVVVSASDSTSVDCWKVNP
jgi:hypothetical protein